LERDNPLEIVGKENNVELVKILVQECRQSEEKPGRKLSFRVLQAKNIFQLLTRRVLYEKKLENVVHFGEIDFCSAQKQLDATIL